MPLLDVAVEEGLEALLAAEPAVAALGLSGTSLRMTAEALHKAHGEQELLASVDDDALHRLRAAAGVGRPPPNIAANATLSSTVWCGNGRGIW